MKHYLIFGTSDPRRPGPDHHPERKPEGEVLSLQHPEVQRLIGLRNENTATYRFAYDAADRLIEEQRIDQLTRRFAYNAGGYLTDMEEINIRERGNRPERVTEFERDTIGRLLAKVNEDGRQTYDYDKGDRLLSTHREPTYTGRKRGIGNDGH